MYQRSGTKAFKKDLTNILSLCDALGQPQNSYKKIHIAGTNGKGTVSHIVAAILQSMGFKVGIYTSPHYVDFRERIKVNGTQISEQYVINWVAENDLLFNQIKPSFFEVTVAMAFDYFRNQEVDIAIIETGLGGRLDSTNIIKPIVSVITHISLDHQSMLGNTIYEIAGEKAGIIKPDTPVVIGRYQSDCDQVFIEKARINNASITWASLNWKVEKNNACKRFTYEDLEIKIDWHPNESPFIQENIITALETIRTVTSDGNIDWNKEIIEAGIKEFRTISNYIGRWQILEDHPLIIADSAHNEDALKKVLEQLASTNMSIHFVIGMVNDKDIDNILLLFPPEAKYYFVNAKIERALPSNKLAQKANEIGLNGNSYSSVSEGINAAKLNTKPNELIYIGGSSFVVGNALEHYS